MLDLYGDPIPEVEEEEVYNRKTELFDFLNNITHKKINIMDIDNEIEKDYVPYVINKFLSQHIDTIEDADTMNSMSHLPNKLQFDYLINSIRKKFRRAEKWLKSETDLDISAVKEYYNYSNQKARDAIRILTAEEISYIKKKIYKGGLKK
mgnify:CR=1 FL=1